MSQPLNKANILAALENVDDPETGKSIVQSERITDIHIADNKVAFTLHLPESAFSLKEQIRKACESSIRVFINKDVEVMVNMDIQTKGFHHPNAGVVLPNVKHIIAVASGKGGVGKSTVATNLAIALAQKGHAVGLLDADIYGPSAPIMFGIQGDRPMMRNVGEKGMIEPIEKFGVRVMSMGLLVDEKQAVIWRGPMATSALRQFVKDVYWGDLDYLILDLPPGTGDVHLTVTSTLPVRGAVIVTTPQAVAMADAKKGMMMFKQGNINVPILGVVENMAYFTPEELPENKYYIFGKDGGKNLADQFEVPFLGEIPLVQSIREGGDRGFPAILNDEPVSRNAFHKVAEEVLANLEKSIAGTL